MAVLPEWLQARAVAVEAALAGGRAAARHFRQSELTVERKSDDSPVTRADRESEAACRAVVAAAFPGDDWLGEESGASAGSAAGDDSRPRRRWIVDPIDGTRNFVRGIPLWSTLVACEAPFAGAAPVIASAVYLPVLDECYDAVRGGGARCNGAPIAVSTVDRLADALFCYETPGWFRRNGLAALFDWMCERTALQRGGGDAFYHMLVASGRAEVVIEPSLSVWDVAATSLVVIEAGGRYSDLNGADDIRSGNAVISNGRVHEEVLTAIASRRGG